MNSRLYEFDLDHEPIFDPESTPILGFENHKFLSNFYLCNVVYKGLSFPSTEHAYVWSKKFDNTKEWYDKVLSISHPGELKRFGYTVKLRKDWDSVKYTIMSEIVRCKFNQNSHLTKLLLSTGNSYIEETNWWKDVYWGVCNGIGENNLGKILMIIRKEFNDVQRNISTI